MTILIDQPEFGIEVEEKKIPDEEKELVLDGGFSVPHSNSFGHNFRSFSLPFFLIVAGIIMLRAIGKKAWRIFTISITLIKPMTL